MPAPSFQPQGNDRDLLSGVRTVAEHHDPTRPTALTMSQFDDGREAPGHPELPAARAICQRLRLGWRDVVAAACGARGRELASAGKRATGSGSRHGLDIDDAVLAVRRAAVRLGVRSLNRAQYAEGREQIIAAAPPAARAAAAASMPDQLQLDGLLRRAELSWPQLCARATLDPPEQRRSVGLTAAQAMTLFVETMQAVPRTGQHLRDWCRHHGIATARWPAGTYPGAVATHADARAAAGLPPLPTADPRDHGQPPSDPDGELPRVRKDSWDRPELVAGLARAIAEHPAGRALRTRSLGPLAREDPAIPHPSTVGRWLKNHPEDSWEGLREEAEVLTRDTTSTAP